MTTVGGIVPDCWVYVQDRSVKMGRFQIYNNWSPYLVKDLENTVWVGLEYFCNEGDAFWSQSEEEFAKLGVEEMLRIGLITDAYDVLDTHMEKSKRRIPPILTPTARWIPWSDTSIPSKTCTAWAGTASTVTTTWTSP